MIIKISFLVVFFALMLAVGFYCRRRATDVSSFVLGGRSVGPWLTAFAYGTSYFSAVIFIGYAGQFGWKFGVSAAWIGIGNALIGSLLSWIVLGRRTRLLSHKLESTTMPELFGSRFQSDKLKIMASAIIFVFLIPYTASLYNGLSGLFTTAFGANETVWIIIMAVLTGIYVVVGGYMATAINDFIQGIVMLVGIAAVVIAVLRVNGGLVGSLDALTGTAGEGFTSLFGPAPKDLIFVILLTSLGTWGLPQMVQKFYAIKSGRAIFKGAVISTVFALIVAGGCYFLGGFGRLFVAADAAGKPVNGFDSVVPTMIGGLSDILIAIVIVLVLSASMSTLSSLVMTSSSTLTIDIVKGHIVKKMPEKRQIFLIRVLIMVFILISVIIALFKPAFIAQLMGISWGALAGSFLAPFLYGLYWKRTTKAACWISFIIGSGVMTLNAFFSQFFPEIFSSSINCGVAVMLLNLIIVPLVSLLTKAPERATVDEMFTCYDKTKGD